MSRTYYRNFYLFKDDNRRIITGRHRNLPDHLEATEPHLDPDGTFSNWLNFRSILAQGRYRRAPADFRRRLNRHRRRKAKQALRRGDEPDPEKNDLDWKWS